MDLVHKLRREKGWSQQQLADASGVSRATVQRVEGGKVTPDKETALSLAAALGADAVRIRQDAGVAARVIRLAEITNARNPTSEELAQLPPAIRQVFANFVAARSELDAVGQAMDSERVRSSAAHEERMGLILACDRAAAAVSESPRDAHAWRTYMDAHEQLANRGGRDGYKNAAALAAKMQLAFAAFNDAWLGLSRVLLQFL